VITTSRECICMRTAIGGFHEPRCEQRWQRIMRTAEALVVMRDGTSSVLTNDDVERTGIDVTDDDNKPRNKSQDAEIRILQALSLDGPDHCTVWWTTGDGHAMPSLSAVVPDVPERALEMMLSRMMRDGLITGCDCGCRGDWEILGPGEDMLRDSGYRGDGTAEPEMKRAQHHTMSSIDDNKPRTELIRGDLARHVMEVVAPGANEQVEENRLREIKAERDVKWGGAKAYYLVEVEPNVWETTGELPHGVPTLRVYKEDPLCGNGIQWEFAKAMLQLRVCREWRKALEIARETEFKTLGRKLVKP